MALRDGTVADIQATRVRLPDYLETQQATHDDEPSAGPRARRRTAQRREAMMAPTKTPRRKKAAWILRLYVAGRSARTAAALSNLEHICEQYMAGQYEIEVIDLLKQPQLARGDQIVAVPTLVRRLPSPVKRIIGDLSDAERVLVGLDLRPKGRSSRRSA